MDRRSDNIYGTKIVLEGLIESAGEHRWEKIIKLKYKELKELKEWLIDAPINVEKLKIRVE